MPAGRRHIQTPTLYIKSYSNFRAQPQSNSLHPTEGSPDRSRRFHSVLGFIGFGEIAEAFASDFSPTNAGLVAAEDAMLEDAALATLPRDRTARSGITPPYWAVPGRCSVWSPPTAPPRPPRIAPVFCPPMPSSSMAIPAHAGRSGVRSKGSTRPGGAMSRWRSWRRSIPPSADRWPPC